ncbi:hypothetical protein [Chamaesiphon sp. VAR_48_metabat_403]|uniref:hypothetical protein n=1 Tax=Chamaesiphon sp. VAR_48_metabat_403 TaxID=2964700 RepID=UPI00286D8265|nr:hypothetical protein [Chamaesiphon sp. VAR_48_metabat_403]
MAAILNLKLLRYFIASILAIVDDRIGVAAVLFLKTSIRSGLNFHIDNCCIDGKLDLKMSKSL